MSDKRYAEGQVPCPICNVMLPVMLEITKIVPDDPVDELDVTWVTEETQESKNDRATHYEVQHGMRTRTPEP